MYKLMILSALLAIAAAKPKPGLLAAPALAAAPLAYAAPAAPFAYAAPAPAVAYAAPAPAVAYAAPAPAPVAYSTGYEVNVAVEPVEQHGYSIAY